MTRHSLEVLMLGKSVRITLYVFCIWINTYRILNKMVTILHFELHFLQLNNYNREINLADIFTPDVSIDNNL